jgi:CelD/BcsL family acetyltransferase involved in cellulose biosynthesis
MAQVVDDLQLLQASELEVGLLAVERIDTLDGLAALAGEWQALSEADPGLPVFLTWEWASTWWRHFGGQAELWVLSGRTASGELAALAPWMRSRSMGIRRLGFLGGGIAYPAHLDLVARPGLEDAAAEAFLGYLLAHRSEWDLLELRGLAAGSALVPALQRAPGRLQPAAPTDCPYMVLGNNWETFQANTLGRKLRRNLKSSRARLEKDHPDQVYFHLAGEPGEVEQVLHHLEEFHHRRWSEKGYSTALDNPRFVAFLHDIALRGLEKGWLRAWELRMGEHTGAVNIAFFKGKTFFGYQKGFDPQWKSYSPGQVLQIELIHEAINEGAEELDMLVGEGHKDSWPAEVRQDLNLLYCQGLKGRLWLAGYLLLERVRLFARRVLPKSVKRRLERVISAADR